MFLRPSTGLVIGLSLGLIAPLPRTAARAGGNVSGTVRDAETGAPLGNTNVYLASTTIGTNTGADGSYALENIPDGTFHLIASRVGYTVGSHALNIGGPGPHRVDFSLRPVPVQGEEVQVIAHVDMQWQRDLTAFTRAFIGGGINALQCRILNPEVINFRKESDGDMLSASSDSVLRIENGSLGYMLYARLGLFSWNVDQDRGQFLLYPRFESLPPRDSSQSSVWQARREASYRGSLRHFLASLVAGTLEREHFSVNSGTLTALRAGASHPISPGDYQLARVPGTPLWMLSFTGWWRVEYRTDDVRQRSFIGLTGDSALLDASGNLEDPLGLQAIGDWTEFRVSDMLPIN